MNSITLFEGRELKCGTDVPFEFMVENADNSPSVHDMEQAARKTAFQQNLRYWNDETCFMSVNNFDNVHYDWIVEQGKDVVPYIYEELKKGEPTFLVYALNDIFPGVVETDGYVPVKEMCEIWLSILQKKYAEKLD